MILFLQYLLVTYLLGMSFATIYAFITLMSPKSNDLWEKLFQEHGGYKGFLVLLFWTLIAIIFWPYTLSKK
jgi:hypothetical protein